MTNQPILSSATRKSPIRNEVLPLTSHAVASVTDLGKVRIGAGLKRPGSVADAGKVRVGAGLRRG